MANNDFTLHDLDLDEAFNYGEGYRVSAEILSNKNKLEREDFIAMCLKKESNNPLLDKFSEYLNNGETPPKDICKKVFEDTKSFDEQKTSLGLALQVQVVNAHIFECLSVEILLKGLNQYFNGFYIKTHSIVKLFDELPNESCSRIAMNYIDEFNPLDNLIKEIDVRFEKWRYQQQITAFMSPGTMINYYVKEMPKLISSIKEEYSHVMKSS